MQIAQIEPGRRDHASPGATLVAPDGEEAISVSDEWLSRHKPEEGGYYVAYGDGYASYSPQPAFENGYTEVKDEDRRVATEDLRFPEGLTGYVGSFLAQLDARVRKLEGR